MAENENKKHQTPKQKRPQNQKLMEKGETEIMDIALHPNHQTKEPAMSKTRRFGNRVIADIHKAEQLARKSRDSKLTVLERMEADDEAATILRYYKIRKLS